MANIPVETVNTAADKARLAVAGVLLVSALVGYYLLAKQGDAWSARQQRHLAYVAEYTADIQHVPGVENVVADALSRPPAVAAVVPPASTGLLNWAQLATGQATCGDLAAISARRPHHLVAVQVEGYPVWCDVSTGV